MELNDDAFAVRELRKAKGAATRREAAGFTDSGARRESEWIGLVCMAGFTRGDIYLQLCVRASTSLRKFDLYE